MLENLQACSKNISWSEKHKLSVNFPNAEPNGQGYYLVPIDQLQLIETTQLKVS